MAPGGGVRSLESMGFCLGMFPNAGYPADTVGIKPGEILCLFTDGIVESMNSEKEEFGDDRLIQQIPDCAGLPARDMLAAISRIALRFTSCAEPSDDLTLVIVKRS